MNKQDMAKFLKGAQASVIKHSPEILTGLGIAGMIATTVFAVRDTPKALRLLEDAEQEKGEALTTPETVKLCWKCYIPSMITGTTSIACLIGANSVHARRNAVLATAYKLSETALAEYREKVVETIGEKKEQTVRDKVAESRVEKNPVTKSNVVITNKGNTLCYDHFSGRYFKSDIERIKRAENDLNKRMIHDIGGYVSLNEFYDELGLDHTRLGDELGWNLDKGLIDISFSSQIADDGTPCIVIDYNVAPQYNYYKLQ